MAVDRDDDRDAHLRRAVAWRRYSRGPVSPLHRRCAEDIVRGSLRLWERGGGVPRRSGERRRRRRAGAGGHPGLPPPAVSRDDVVLVSGPWLAGTTAWRRPCGSGCPGTRSSKPAELRPASRARRGGVRGVGDRAADRIGLRAARRRGRRHRRGDRAWSPRSTCTAPGATCSRPTANRGRARPAVRGRAVGRVRPRHRTWARRWSTTSSALSDARSPMLRWSVEIGCARGKLGLTDLDRRSRTRGVGAGREARLAALRERRPPRCARPGSTSPSAPSRCAAGLSRPGCSCPTSRAAGAPRCGPSCRRTPRRPRGERSERSTDYVRRRLGEVAADVDEAVARQLSDLGAELGLPIDCPAAAAVPPAEVAAAAAAVTAGWRPG